MEAEYDIFEIVAVIGDFWLIDAESYQRRYCFSRDKSLAAGYYVVNWPEHIRARRFNEQASFHGPFKSRNEARVTLDRMSRELVLSPKGASIAVLNSKRMTVKKAVSQELRLVEGTKTGRQIAENLSPDYRQALKFGAL
ncbi:MAG: hypothetical protein PHR16_05120 [Methylovulum sp.]|nr:hypothetical protein [Methylovulum sp.]